jgi:hypothetical protein
MTILAVKIAALEKDHSPISRPIDSAGREYLCHKARWVIYSWSIRYGAHVF